MEKPKEPVKVIEFDKATAQLQVRVETENNLISNADKDTQTGTSKSVLTQVIYKNGIKELLKTLEDQKVKHTQAKEQAQTMLDGEIVALEMIEKDYQSIKDAIGDLEFKEEPAEPEKADEPTAEPSQ